MAASASASLRRRHVSPLPQAQSAPLEILSTVGLAIQLTAMSPQLRQLFESMLDCMAEDASVIAALKAANAELQQCVWDVCGIEADGPSSRHSH